MPQNVEHIEPYKLGNIVMSIFISWLVLDYFGGLRYWDYK